MADDSTPEPAPVAPAPIRDKAVRGSGSIAGGFKGDLSRFLGSRVAPATDTKKDGE